MKLGMKTSLRLHFDFNGRYTKERGISVLKDERKKKV